MNGRLSEIPAALGRIVILVDGFERRGSVRQAYLLAREFGCTRRCNVEVWVLWTRQSLPKLFQESGIPTRVLNFEQPRCPFRPVRTLIWAERLLRVALAMRRAGIKVLLPFDSRPNVVAGMTYRFAGIPVCIWGQQSANRASGEPKAAQKCGAFVANSTAGVEFLVQEAGIARDRIRLIPNAVEQPLLTLGADWRARLGLASGQPLIVMVGDIMKPRDYGTLLRAWRVVQEAWPNPHTPVLALAGTFGDAYPEALHLVRKLGLDYEVRFLGPINDVASLIESCDLGVFSSDAEGMPNGVLECMVAGKAVVASDIPGIRDALGPDGTHVLFPVRDAERCAELILKLLRDAAARAAIGDANRERTRREFSVERMVDRYFDVIRTVGFALSVWDLNIADGALASARDDA